MKKLLIFLLVAAVLVAGWLILRPRATVADEANATPAAKVETTALADRPIAQTIEVFGVVAAAPSGDHVISTPYDVVVRKVAVSAGTPVAAGDLLLEIGPSPDARLASDSANNGLVLAAKALAGVQERYDLKLANSQELLAAQQAAQDAKLKVDSFTARGLGGDGRIIAPVAGVVSRLDLFAGAFAPAGTALVTVSTGGELEARLGVEAADAGAVAAGHRVMLESSNRTAPEKIAAAVRSVGAALDPATGAVEARVPVPAGAPLLLGEHVRAQIELQRKDHALVVPRSAVLPDDAKQVLFTVKNGKAVRHEVKLGLASGEFLEVIGDGLQAGDEVVTLGNYELEDGMAVQAPEKEGKKSDAAAPTQSTAEAKP